MLPRVGHSQEGLGKSCGQDQEQLLLMALEHSTWRDRTRLLKGWEHLNIAGYSKFKECLSGDRWTLLRFTCHLTWLGVTIRCRALAWLEVALASWISEPGQSHHCQLGFGLAWLRPRLLAVDDNYKILCNYSSMSSRLILCYYHTHLSHQLVSCPILFQISLHLSYHPCFCHHLNQPQ